MAGRVTGVLNAIGIGLGGHEQKKQILALDDEFHEMDLEITRLNAKILHLEAKVNPLEKEIEGYKKKLEQQQARSLHLTVEEEKIMKTICRGGQAMFAGVIADETQLNRIRVDHFLTQLQQRGLVRDSIHWQGGRIYGLSEDGKAFAVEHGWA